MEIEQIIRDLALLIHPQAEACGKETIHLSRRLQPVGHGGRKQYPMNM